MNPIVFHTAMTATHRLRGSLAASFAVSAAVLVLASNPAQLEGQTPSRQVVDLTLERMVELALSNSYQVRQLNLSIDRTQLQLRSQRARLRSSVDLDLSAPDFRSMSETNWNPGLGRNEIVHEDSRRMEAELSVRQPVILFGYPTNGYLSLNNRIYRYSQLEADGSRDLQYYNRYYVQYTQPLFQPNELKNDLEEAELDLEDSELEFYDDVVGIVDDVSDDYFELFQESYGEVINQAYVSNLEAAESASLEVVQADTSRTIEVGQIRVDLANAREQLQRVRGEFRLEASRLKTRLNIPETDSITLNPVIDIRPLTIDVEQATRFALELTPRMRQLGIQYRENQLNLEQTKGRGGFQMDLAVSYGREMRDPNFGAMWGLPSNTYTVGVDASIPIWDWGERKYRVQASEVSIRQTELRIEEAEVQIRANVRNEIRNVEEYQTRALAMEANLILASDLSEESLIRYEQGEITALDLLQSFRREVDTAQNLMDAYLGWRRSINRLQEITFYDFETGMPVLESFGVSLQPS